MSRALRELGLGPDADAREVKRAYAALLRTCRPDEDADRFQQLRHTYEAALEQLARRTAGHTIAVVPQAVALQAAPTPAPAPANPRMDSDAGPGAGTAAAWAAPAPATPATGAAPFDFPAFYAALRARIDADGQAGIGGVAGLEQWLRTQHALYDLSLKDRIAERLVAALRQDIPLPCAHLDALLRFFALDTINALSWPLQDQLRDLVRDAQAAGHADGGPDWSRLAFDPARGTRPAPAASPVPAWAVRLLLVALFVLWRIAAA